MNSGNISMNRHRIFKLFRWLHVYISCAAFGLLIFFSFTGITLNHVAWFKNEYQTGEQTIAIPQELLNSLDHKSLPGTLPAEFIHKLEHHLHINYGVEASKSVSVDRERHTIEINYSLPAGYAVFTFDLSTLEGLIEYQEGGIFSFMNDLHKGRHTGKVWQWLIDISAVIIILASITGLILLFQLVHKIKPGMIVLIFGILTPFLVILFIVPTLKGIP